MLRVIWVLYVLCFLTGLSEGLQMRGGCHVLLHPLLCNTSAQVCPSCRGGKSSSASRGLVIEQSYAHVRWWGMHVTVHDCMRYF